MNRINNLLERLLKVRLIRSASLPKKSAKQSNIVVEFIGPSGVGKSTLCDYFVKRTSRKKGILRMVDLIPYVRDKRIELSGIYEALLSAKIDEVAMFPCSGLQKSNQISYYHKILSILSLIEKYLVDKIVVLDEGLFQMYGRQIQNIEGNPQIQEIFDRTILIHCTASADFVYKNIQKRAKSEKVVQLFHQGHSKEALYSLIEQNIGDINNFVQQLKNKGVLVVEVNTEHSLADNAELIDSRLREVLNDRLRVV